MNSFKKFINKSTAAPAEPTYPHLSVQTSGPTVLVETAYRPDEVFKSVDAAQVQLATFDAPGRLIRVLFEPMHEQSRAGNVAKLRVESNGEALLLVELPELTDRAQFRQITASEHYKSLMTMLRSAVAASSRISTNKPAGMPGWGVALLLVLGLVTCILLFGPKISGTPSLAISALPLASHSSNTQAPQTSQAPGEVPVQLSQGDQLNEVEKSALAKIVSQSGIELSSGGKPFIIFSDPNCPACRELEVKLATLDKSLSPIIVPVSFKENSATTISGILCSRDVTASWRSVMAVAPITGAISAPLTLTACEKGQEQARMNNAAFVALRFDRTPTIVTSTGKVAVGAKDFEGLIAWVRANSGG